jgi:molecular chaperone GrpE
MKKPKMQTETSGEPAAGATAPAGAEPLAPLEPGTVTPERLQQLTEQAAKAEEHWDRLVRTAADFDNYKKRAVREKQEAVFYANEALMQKLIPVMDSLDMALAAAQTGAGGAAESLETGLRMVGQQLRNALREAGLEEVDATGKTFNPNLHEAVAQRETAEVPEGQVVQQMRKGYKLRERLLRPASVIVAKAPAAA